MEDPAVTAKPAPMSREAWLIDSEMRGGHSVAEVLGYLCDCADYADQQQGRWRSVPDGFVLADCEPRLVTAVRRWFGR